MYDYISSQVNRVGANDQKIVKGGSYDDMILIVLNFDGAGQDVTNILTIHDYSVKRVPRSTLHAIILVFIIVEFSPPT